MNANGRPGLRVLESRPAAVAGEVGYLVLTVIVATPTSRPLVTAVVLNTLSSAPAAVAEMCTVVPVSTAVPSAVSDFSGSRVLPSRSNRTTCEAYGLLSTETSPYSSELPGLMLKFCSWTLVAPAVSERPLRSFERSRSGDDARYLPKIGSYRRGAAVAPVIAGCCAQHTWRPESTSRSVTARQVRAEQS